ncbi:MAG: c-type cytochrome, partial [Rhodospirillales bacterium]|nr:c-type cytochrome [Rhodospirillales bacterium]
SVVFADATSGSLQQVIALTESSRRVEDDPVRYGEQIFHDADFCFQQWLSCATCHPDGRVDGLNWDLLNDGLGNPKNAKSMVWSFKTPPAMSLGVRADMKTAVAAGFRHIQFRQVDDAVVEATSAYLRSLEPLPSPHLSKDGNLTESALRGKSIFLDNQVGCTYCHSEPLYTDLQIHDVGTRSELDRTDAFDTPTLVELWRSGPYLHDGSAKNLREVLIDRNPEDKHGHTSQLNEQQVNDLIEYLLSL